MPTVRRISPYQEIFFGNINTRLPLKIAPFAECIFSKATDREAANLVCQPQISILGFSAQFDRIFRAMHNSLKRHQLDVLAPSAAHRRFDQP